MTRFVLIRRSILLAGALAAPFAPSAALDASPVLSFSIAPALVRAGESAILTWSSTGWSSPVTCKAGDAWSGTQPLSGHALTSPTTPGSYQYTLSCMDSNGVFAGGGATLTVTKNGFSNTDLAANISGTAAPTVDANLEDPWGIALEAKRAAAVANRDSNTSTSYDGSGARQPAGPAPAALVIHLPAGAGGLAFNPTGVVAPSTVAYTVTASGKSAASQLIYSGESGRMAAWSPAVDPANAIAVYSASDGAVYRGLAISGDFLYATDFHNNKIDVFDATFKKQPHASYPFVDPALPAGYAPFGIGVNGSDLYVTFARQLAPANRDAMSGAGLGLVDVFDLNGHLLKRLVAPGGLLNAPWGVTAAPGGNLDIFSSKLLVANTGDGRIHAFDPATGALVGTLSDSTGTALAIPALHAIAFGNRYANQPDVSLFFTQGASNGAAGGYGRIDFGARPRFHAPPTIAVGVTQSVCTIAFLCGCYYTVQDLVLAEVTDVRGIGKVELDVQIKPVRGPISVSTVVRIAAPYDATYSFCPSLLHPAPAVSASATATDVDGNVASAP